MYFVGPESKKVLHVYLFDGHFEPITSVPALFGRSYHCETCNTDIATRRTIDATRMAAPAATPKNRALLNAGLTVRTATGE